MKDNSGDVLTISCDNTNLASCFSEHMYTYTKNDDSTYVLREIKNENLTTELREIVFSFKQERKTNVTYSDIFEQRFIHLSTYKGHYLSGSAGNSSGGFISMSLVLYSNDSSSPQELKFDLIKYL